MTALHGALTRVPFEIGVSDVAPAGVHHLRGDVFVAAGARPDLVFCGLPGGGMSRRYFDLDVAPEHGNYSMARHLATRGHAVVLLDHPGVGQSDVPDDAYSLTPECVADVDACGFERVLARLRDGTLDPSLAPLPLTRSVGLGHSAGSSITVYLQARHRPHVALALLGYGGGGLPTHLSEREQAYVNDPEAVRRDIASLVAERHGEALPTMRRGSSDFLVGKPMPPPVHEALVAARSPLLALVGLSSMITGSARPVIEAIDVPVFLALGDRDIAGSPHVVPAQFTSCHDVTLFVLDDAGHNHNVADTREKLWDRVLDWASAVTG